MHVINFRCRVCAPHMVGGADGNRFEPRTAPFKALLRYWWRAMHGHLPVPILLKKQALVWGGAEPAQKSPFRISIKPQENWYSSEYPLLPHKTGFRASPKNGLDDGQDYIFQIRFSRAPNIYDKSKLSVHEQLISHTTLAFLLGGVGKRSRRGYGSSTILQTQSFMVGDQIQEWKDFQMPESLDEIMELLESLQPSTFKPINNKIERIQPSREPFPFILKIAMGAADTAPHNLLKTIGNATHNLKGAAGNNRYEAAMGHTNRRFASPVYTTINERQNGQYYPLVTILNTKHGPRDHNARRVSFSDILNIQDNFIQMLQ